tara:strand:- start:1515 stop:2012 length:498 start_codon:yes stop_codon:yes gene_type:complete
MSDNVKFDKDEVDIALDNWEQQHGFSNKYSTNTIGVYGELSVYRTLIRQGYGSKIYKPISDENHVDLVVETNQHKFDRVQIKTVTKMNTATSIEVKMGKYTKSNRVDVVAVFFAPKEAVAFVPYKNTNSITLALTVAKNNQGNRNWFWQYERYPEFTGGHTSNDS